MRYVLLTALALSIASAAACGGSQPAPNPPATETDAGAAAAPNASNASNEASSGSAADAGTASVSSPTPAPETKKEPDFDDLPADKKVDIMMTKVVPNVGKLFKEHDGKKYAKFGCATCHGPGKKKEDPHKILPKLVFKGEAGEKMKKTKGDMMKFMSEKVVPAMAEALGEKPIDPKTGKGFGCKGCHTVEE